MKMEDKKTTKNVFACWSCKKPVTMRERAEADGNCPHCDVELDVDDWPLPSGVPAAQPQGEPFAWYTEDYLSDKSATTYDLATMERWKAKGWPVSPLFIEQPEPVAVVNNA